ncbi:glucose 1-dehydrogenase [Bradyrhizobium sp. WSM3983]|uniref:glucose 1-dehydrogenase n=1 Tax=Bradyrhizobium sp. WSM3983 TaxID=1038867 RepID=UPI0004194E5A|nr:glucose 1-dehydrogenase [Bradyrhizobium sp. WSM3983]
MRLADKVAIVTGAASGIGRAVADLFAEHGATVYATDLDERDGSERIVSVRQDVSVESEWSALIARIEREQGRLDVLVNNAGIVGSYDSITDVAMADYHRIIAVNQTGFFLGMRCAIPLMQRGGKGSIVNVSSIWGLIGAVGVAAYQASKGAVTTLTKNAALTYAPVIRANSLHPGAILTRIIEKQDHALNQQLIADTPLGRMAEPREVAYAALYLASDESAFVTGAELVIDGGYTIR